MDFDEQVAGMQVILRGWIQNLARNAQGEGFTLEPEVILMALDGLKEEYDLLVSGDIEDIEEALRLWTGGNDGSDVQDTDE